MHGLQQGKGSHPGDHKEIVNGLGVAERNAVARVPLETDYYRLEEADN